MDMLCLTALAFAGLAKGLNVIQDRRAEERHRARMAELQRDGLDPDVLDERHL